MIQFFLTGGVFVVKDTPVLWSMAFLENISILYLFFRNVLKME